MPRAGHILSLIALRPLCLALEGSPYYYSAKALRCLALIHIAPAICAICAPPPAIADIFNIATAICLLRCGLSPPISLALG
jgi:hypothetical protein